MIESVETPKAEVLASAAKDWETAVESLDDDHTQSDWDMLVRNHIVEHLEPVETLENEDGMQYGSVYAEEELDVIFGGDRPLMPNNDVTDQFLIRPTPKSQ